MKKVLVLGGGCAKCDLLVKEVEKASELAGVEIDLEKVSDFEEIMKYGVMTTPALVVDGEVKFSGKLVKAKKLVSFLQ